MSNFKFPGESKEAVERVAAHFRALSEPTRLRILRMLVGTERCVGELAEMCNHSSPNISRHLAILRRRGIVACEERGTSAYYRIADESVYALVEMVSESIAQRPAYL